MAKHRLDPDKYTVGWVSALPIELAAAKVMLDEEHGTETGGSALYTLGRIGDHNVVLGCLPAGQMGTSSAAVVGTLMKEKYKAIRFGMMVGIGGGVPSGESDIRLGDVVVSQPHLEHGGVIQYDYGKETTKGFVRTGSLSPPPAILLNALARLRADHYVNISGLSSYFTPFYSLPNFGRDRAGPDLLFNSSYEHVAGATCDGCNRNETINRRPRGDLHAEIHYGTIASGNQVIKRAIKRDELSSELGGILCFEMEAAGLMNTFPCLVIRGICDYADSHKNKAWQPYAAATAAACAKALINIIPDDDVRETLTTAETTYVRPTERKLRMTQVEKKCLQSLYFSEMYFRQNDISDPASDTCEWLLEHSMYNRWIRWEHPLLWIKGNPGAGKSTLLRHMLTLHEQDPDEHKPIVASFFFHGRGTAMQKSLLGLFRSLLHQILQHFRHLLQKLSSIFERRCKTEGEIGVKWNWQEKDLQDFFKRNVPNAAIIHPVRVYIDAPDESGEIVAQKLVKFFEAITSSPNPSETPLSICFSCRQYPLVSLEDGFEICVDAENRQDIVAYIRENIQSSIRDENIAARVQREVLQKSLSNFQWVVLVLPKIIQSYRKGQWRAIQKYIQDIPSELSQLYQKLIEEIDDETLSESLQLLQWICFAQRPLSLKELRFAMIVDADTPYHSILECQDTEKYAETDEEMKSRVRDLSKGLAEVRLHEGKQVAQFIHQSVKDYLLQSGLQTMSKSTIDSVIGSAHYRHSRSCIRYISMKEIGDCIRKMTAKTSATFDFEKWNEIEQNLPFIEYAVTSWILHAEIAQENNHSNEDLFSFLQHQSHDILNIWIQIYRNIRDPWDRNSPIYRTTPLHIASKYNLISVINNLFCSYNVDVNSRNSDHETPLHLAAANGHQAVVRLLIEHGNVELNCRYRGHRTPLFLAAKNGHEAATEVLIEHSNIEVNSKNRYGDTPLHLAAKGGHQAVFQLLIKRADVNINSQDIYRRTPLYLAAEKGHEAIVKSLLKRKDVDVNCTDIFGWTLLSAAAAAGHETVVKLLFQQNDIKINLKNQDDQSPLFLAAKNGHDKTIELFIKRSDVDLNSTDCFNRTPLHIAAQNGHDKMIELFIKRSDVDLNSKDCINRTPLYVAAQNGHDKTIELFINRNNVDINSKDCFNETPLYVAAAGGHESVVQLLLTRDDIEWTSPAKSDPTPLDVAIKYGHKVVVELLQRHSQAATQRCSDAGSVVEWSAGIGREKGGGEPKQKKMKNV